MKLKILRPDQYRQRRSQLRKHIIAAVKYSDLDVFTVEANIEKRERMPVLITENGRTSGLMLLEQDGTRLHITTLSGDFSKDWHLELFKHLRLLAGCCGCDALQLRGRKAWTRLLAPLGFKTDQEFLVCEV